MSNCCNGAVNDPNNTNCSTPPTFPVALVVQGLGTSTTNVISQNASTTNIELAGRVAYMFEGGTSTVSPVSVVTTGDNIVTLTIPAGHRIMFSRKNTYTSTTVSQSLVIDTSKAPGVIFINITNGIAEVYQPASSDYLTAVKNTNLYYFGYTNPYRPKTTTVLNSATYTVEGELHGVGVPQDVSTQIKNNPIYRKNIADKFNILVIGSSWMVCSVWYLNKMLKNAGINAKINLVYKSGGKFEEWNTLITGNTPPDVFYISDDGSDWVTQPSYGTKSIIQSENWDLVFFQQGAASSVDWTLWAEHGTTLLHNLKRYTNSSAVFGFNSTFTPPVQGMTSLGYPNTVAGQLYFQLANYGNTKRFLSTTGIDIAAPNGATMWSTRRNGTLNVLNDLATDGLHPDNGLPIYALALTIFETFAPQFYNKSLTDVAWLPDTNTQRHQWSTSTFQTINSTQATAIKDIVKSSIGDRFSTRTL